MDYVEQGTEIVTITYYLLNWTDVKGISRIEHLYWVAIGPDFQEVILIGQFMNEDDLFTNFVSVFYETIRISNTFRILMVTASTHHKYKVK